MGITFGNVPVAASGQIVIRGVPQYDIVLYTDVATIGARTTPYDQPEPKAVTSGKVSSGVQEIRLPSIENFVPGWRRAVNVTSEPTKEDRARAHIRTFLMEVYSLSQIGDTDSAGFKIFDFLDRVLTDGFNAVCDNILGMVDVEKLDTKLMRSFLSVTLAAKQKLPSRAALYGRIERKMMQLRGPEKTRRIIGSLA
ncbi:MAG: hypothetical protein JNM56_26970 [Planctomycetia bacterium]|nr:hypothetical protein [Planctomycetia bacterium]